MRYLGKKQKNILIDYAKDNYFILGNGTLLIEKYGNKNILLMQLEKVNDYETLWSDLDRLISDLRNIKTKEEQIAYIKNFR